MILEAYSVYDAGVKAFMQPFFVRSKGEALRSFMDACTDGKAPFMRHPGDYTLYWLASYDDATGLFSSNERDPVRVISALEVVKKEEGDQ